jgi:hypothetical protein
MPFHVRIVEPGRVVLVRGLGPATTDDWFALAAHPGLPDRRAGYGLIVDLRRRETLPTPEEAREVGRRLTGVAWSHFVAVALVARPGAQFGLARSVDLLTQLEGGLPTATFVEMRAAWEWLRGVAR